MSRLADTLRSWPRRRWVIVAFVAPVVAGLLALAGPGHGWWGWPLVLLTTVLAPLILASYLPVPGSGRMIEVGCTPCATVAGGAVLLAIYVGTRAPNDPLMALIAAVALIAAMRQRLADATACAAPRRLPPQ